MFKRLLNRLLCIHAWSKWSRLVDAYSGHKQQWRECTTCGKAQFRTLSWDKQSSLSQANQALQSVNPVE